MKQPWLIEYQYQLSTQIIQNKLPHAILLAGIDGAGKKSLAQWLIHVLLCQQVSSSEHLINEHLSNGQTPSINNSQATSKTLTVLQPCGQCKHCQLYHAGSFPDHQSLTDDKPTIGVDEVRQTNTFLQKTAQLSGVKTVLIPQAHRMTESASNALLKTLEEPTQHSHLILLTPDPQRLLATIISRCHVINIRTSITQVLATLPGQVAHDDFQNLSHINELANPDLQQAYQRFQHTLSEFLLGENNQHSLLAMLTENEEAMRWCEKLFTDMLRCSYGWPVNLPTNLQQAINTHAFTTSIIQQCYHVFLQSQKQLMTLVQANKSFVLEAMLITIKQQLLSAPSNPTTRNSI